MSTPPSDFVTGGYPPSDNDSHVRSMSYTVTKIVIRIEVYNNIGDSIVELVSELPSRSVRRSIGPRTQEIRTPRVHGQGRQHR